MLSPHQVDSILKYLDAAEPTVLSSGNDAAVRDHNFAVFASRPARPSSSNEGSSWQAPIPANSGPYLSNEVNNVSRFTDHSVCDDVPHADDVNDTYGGSLVEGVDIPILDNILTTGMPPIPRDATDSQSTKALGIVEVHQAAERDWLDAGGSPTSSPHSGLDLDHFLMRHYAERVCHLFCVIDTVKSPWKTIHLPRALMSMGESSVTGKTTTVRSALCNALLSISAWYLSNDHQRHQNTELGRRWADVAARYGYNAIAMLKRAVDSDMYSSPKPKYKEFLASMLSMVTINVSIIGVDAVKPVSYSLTRHRSCLAIPTHAEFTLTARANCLNSSGARSDDFRLRLALCIVSTATCESYTTAHWCRKQTNQHSAKRDRRVCSASLTTWTLMKLPAQARCHLKLLGRRQCSNVYMVFLSSS